MYISNTNLTTTLRIIIGSLFLIGVADLILAFVPGSLNQYFFGYSIFVFPAIIIAAYAYVGLPLFSFDGEAEILHFKSHMVFNRFVGKELFISRNNVISISIDRSGIRKKLVVLFMKDGKEIEEKFGITFLSRHKVDKLAKSIDLIVLESRNTSSPHLFI